MDTEWTCYIIRKALNLNGLGFLNGGGGGIRSCSLACNGNSAFYFKYNLMDKFERGERDIIRLLFEFEPLPSI